MSDQRKYRSMEEWRKAEGGEMQKQQGRGGNQDRPRLPERYLAHGYFDEKGYLRRELITTEALEVARQFVGIQMTSGQLRRFFAHVRQASRRLVREPFEAVLPAVLEMMPLVADTVGRAKAEGKDYALFKTFIDSNVERAAHGQKEFEEGFLKHFMYVIAYFKYLKPKG